MHRSYQPITPASNKLLKQRWDDASFEEHRRKVATSKAVVDNKPPKTYMHLHLKLKKLQLEEERLATIERDNRILLEKMSQIMRTKGRVDNWNDYSLKSLNRTKRQQELLRVTHENQAILKRVLAQKPVYDHVKWTDDYMEKECYMESISKYPKEWYKISSHKKKSPLKTKKKKSSKRDNGSTSSSSYQDDLEVRSNETKLSPSASVNAEHEDGQNYEIQEKFVDEVHNYRSYEPDEKPEKSNRKLEEPGKLDEKPDEKLQEPNGEPEKSGENLEEPQEKPERKAKQMDVIAIKHDVEPDKLDEKFKETDEEPCELVEKAKDVEENTVEQNTQLQDEPNDGKIADADHSE